MVSDPVSLAALRTRLTRFLRRHVSAWEADDLCHDVIVGLLVRNSDTPIRNVQHYVVRAAANAVKQQRKRDFRDATLERDLLLHVNDDTQLNDLPPDPLMIEALATAIDHLPEQTRRIFLMQRSDGLSYGEIAEQLAISKSAVEKSMMRALRHLRAAMGEYL